MAQKLYADKARRGALRIRVTALLSRPDDTYPVSVGQVREILAAQQPLRGIDRRWFAVAGVKLRADGVPIGSRTAWMREPYVGGGRGGLLTVGASDSEKVAELTAMIALVHRAGLQPERGALPRRRRWSLTGTMRSMTDRLDRRGFLRAGAATVIGGAWLMGCGTETSAERTTGSGARVLLAYFSRPGENYHYGGRRNLQVGNTEILAGLISDSITCDVHRIEAAEPYSDDYDNTVARNVREQDADARPAIANPLPSIDGHDVVLLASGIWNVRPPMIMRTFTENLDFTGKTVLPVTTHAMSGLGRAAEDYAQACPGATVGDGLAVRGEEVNQARDAVSSWLARVGLR